MPSVNEIITGLLEWIVMRTELRTKDVNEHRARRMIKMSKDFMEQILKAINLDESERDKPLKIAGRTDIALTNPYSAVTCWLLYLYSMELGQPALYLELNRVSRDMDLSLLKQLGPFARALCYICTAAETNKKEEDKILNGEEFGGEEYNLAGCFLLWRGAAMK